MASAPIDPGAGSDSASTSATERPSLSTLDAGAQFDDLRLAAETLLHWLSSIHENLAISLRPAHDATGQFGYDNRKARALRGFDSAFEGISALAHKARVELNRAALQQAVLALAGVLGNAASPNLIAEGGAGYGVLALKLGRVSKLPNDVRVRAERGADGGSVHKEYWELAGSDDAQAFDDELSVLAGGRTEKPLDDVSKLPGSPPFGLFPPLAEVIARSAASTHSTAAIEVKRAASKTRIAGVEFEGFRGAPGRFRVDFVARDQAPVSVLIFGDNAVGKSTIVDAIEFALQGRIGRSADFESGLEPAAVSFAGKPSTWARVTLSDATSVHREVATDSEGRFVAAGPEIRQEFVHAPVSFKRSDILRFLDTAAMSRGTLLFDYFPEETRALGLRPDEQLKALGDEMTSLYVRRRTLAASLSPILGVASLSLENASEYGRAVKAFFYADRTIEQFEMEGGWSSVAPEIRDLVLALRNVHIRLRQLRRVSSRGAELLNPKRYQRQAAALKKRVERVGDEITRAFLQVTGAKHVRRLHVAFAESGPLSLDLVVTLSNGRACFPQQVFSEGFRDLIALLFFLAVSREAANEGQARVLVLDDVLQSVDSGVREGVMEYIIDSFPDWQLVITIHDRLWLERLRVLLSRKGHRFVDHRISRWSFGDGPVMDGGAPAQLAALERAFAAADVASICSEAGRALELAASQLSWRLATSVIRKKDDKYTLADLWPGIVKALRRSDVRELVAKIEKVTDLRNLVGAHYNEWAQALPLSEADAFGGSVAAFFRSMFCTECHDWVERVAAPSRLVCRCGRLSVGIER